MLSKEHNYYKIRTLLMKSSAYQNPNLPINKGEFTVLFTGISHQKYQKHEKVVF